MQWRSLLVFTPGRFVLGTVPPPPSDPCANLEHFLVAAGPFRVGRQPSSLLLYPPLFPSSLPTGSPCPPLLPLTTFDPVLLGEDLLSQRSNAGAIRPSQSPSIVPASRPCRSQQQACIDQSLAHFNVGEPPSASLLFGDGFGRRTTRRQDEGPRGARRCSRSIGRQVHISECVL